MIVTNTSLTRTGNAENCCDDPGCGLGLRNHYFDGKRLTTTSFRLEQAHAIEHRRLLNRAIHGWGLVYGYSITAEGAHNSREAAAKLKVGGGLLLDEGGRELYLPEAIDLSIRDVIVLDEKGVPAVDPQEELGRECGEDERWQLSAHYAEYDVDPVNQQDSCNCSHRHWDHVCETVRFSLRRVHCDACCLEPACQLRCACAQDGCCDPESEARVAPSTRRGGCSCLCHHLTTKVKIKEDGRLCEVEGPCCRTFRVALKEPVPLACVDIVQYCDQWTFGVRIEECGPRPLVKRNDLLFDLIRGCDLTRIIDIGWRDWHRSPHVDFSKFSAGFGAHYKKGEEYLTEIFWVKFSGPVRKETVQPDCVSMQVLTREKKDGWLEPLRVPIVRLDTLGFECPGHDEWVTGFRFVVGGRWLDDGVRGRDTIFDGAHTQVEIEIRTDFIADCNGQAVDGNPCGLIPAPTGKGVPGGALLSTFVVYKAVSA
jgi:hypothetical protein